jgi:cell volume regulation protein A
MLPIEVILVALSGVFILGVLASKASVRLGVPALLLFLVIGMLGGSEGPGGIAFDDPWLAQALGVIALVFILFAGGLDTDWHRVRPVLGRGIVLSTLAVLASALLVGLFAAYLLGFSLLEGCLLGAIVSSTDAAAVFSVLRSRSVSLKGRLKDVLELESGSNDPMAVFLTVGIISLVQNPETPLASIMLLFLRQMALGGVAGYLMGLAIAWLVNHIRLQYEGLYPVLTFSLVLLAYGATATVGGNGFLAVYVAGLVVGNRDIIHRRSLHMFHDGLAWLMQIAMFITLGLLVFPSRLLPVAGAGLALSFFLMLVARPVSVFSVLLFDSRMRWRHKLLVSWVGLRGAVPIILATFPLLAGMAQAELIFDLVFFIVLTSVLVQGTSIPWVARWLGLAAPLKARREYPIEYAPTRSIKSALEEFEVQPGSRAVGKQIVEMGLPPGALIVGLNRDGEFQVPGGSTVFRPGDTLLVLAEKKVLAELRAILEPERRETE